MAKPGVVSAVVVAATAAPALAGGVLAAQTRGGDPGAAGVPGLRGPGDDGAFGPHATAVTPTPSSPSPGLPGSLDTAGPADLSAPGAVDVVLAAFMAVAAVIVLTTLVRRGIFRRRALLDSHRDVSTVHPGALALLAIAVFLAGDLAIKAASGLGLLGGDGTGGGGTLRAAALGALFSAGAGSIAAVAAVMALGERGRRAGFTARPVDALVGVGALLLVFPVIFTAGAAARLAAALAGRPPAPALAHETLRSLVEAPWTGWWWVAVVGVVVLAPVVEEVVYRGFLQTALAGAGLPRWWAVVATGVLFTLVHASIVEPVALPQLFVLSLGLGVVFERTGRLGAAVAMHAAFNALNIAIAHAVA